MEARGYYDAPHKENPVLHQKCGIDCGMNKKGITTNLEVHCARARQVLTCPLHTYLKKRRSSAAQQLYGFKVDKSTTDQVQSMRQIKNTNH
jgi:hypothetical protein